MGQAQSPSSGIEPSATSRMSETDCLYLGSLSAGRLVVSIYRKAPKVQTINRPYSPLTTRASHRTILPPKHTFTP
jgi:hypothetical protein